MSYLDNPTWLERTGNILSHHHLMASWFRSFAESFELKGNERVLDFGGGSGPLSRHIAEILKDGSGRVTLLDPTTKWVNTAKQLLSGYDNVDYILGDVSALNGTSGEYDVVAINFMLHDLDKAIRQETINALAKVLKDGGRLIIREPTRESHGMSPDEIRTLMGNAGLVEERSNSGKVWLSMPWFAGVYIFD
jgi:ubiquinone/menaquinone biosynthesis C-methylase UbiE